jgi:hypothetical protein
MASQRIVDDDDWLDVIHLDASPPNSFCCGWRILHGSVLPFRQEHRIRSSYSNSTISSKLLRIQCTHQSFAARRKVKFNDDCQGTVTHTPARRARFSFKS